VEDACKEGVLKTIKLLEDLGHKVEEKDPPVNGRKLAASYLMLYYGEVAASMEELEHVLGRKAKLKDVEPATWLIGLVGKVLSAKDFVLSLREWDIAAFQMEQFHETYDFFVTPTTAYLPSQIGEQDTSPVENLLISITSKLKLTRAIKSLGILDKIAEESLKRTPFTQLANLTGQPAMSVPMYLSEDGLPVGVQFMAARGKEDIILNLAAQLEQTDHWINVKTSPGFLK
jgi:amidase